MVVLTGDGFVHLSGCYAIRAHSNGEGAWFVRAEWGDGNGITLIETNSEAEARRLTDRLSRVAWGDGAGSAPPSLKVLVPETTDATPA